MNCCCGHVCRHWTDTSIDTVHSRGVGLGAGHGGGGPAACMSHASMACKRQRLDPDASLPAASMLCACGYDNYINIYINIYTNMHISSTLTWAGVRMAMSFGMYLCWGRPYLGCGKNCSMHICWGRPYLGCGKQMGLHKLP